MNKMGPYDIWYSINNLIKKNRELALLNNRYKVDLGHCAGVGHCYEYVKQLM